MNTVTAFTVLTPPGKVTQFLIFAASSASVKVPANQREGP